MLQSAIKTSAFALNKNHSISVLRSDENSNESPCVFCLFGSSKQKTNALGKKTTTNNLEIMSSCCIYFPKWKIFRILNVKLAVIVA